MSFTYLLTVTLHLVAMTAWLGAMVAVPAMGSVLVRRALAAVRPARHAPGIWNSAGGAPVVRSGGPRSYRPRPVPCVRRLSGSSRAG